MNNRQFSRLEGLISKLLRDINNEPRHKDERELLESANLEVKAGEGERPPNSLREKDQNNKWGSVIDRVERAVLVVTLVATLWQAYEARIANAITRETLTIGQRAFVALKIIQIDRIGAPDGAQWRFSPLWTNVGSSVAVDTVSNINVRVMDSPPNGDLFVGSRPSNTSFIGPSMEALGAGKLVSSEFLPMNGTAQSPHYFTRRFAWGWAFYRDIFAQPHVTEFCFELMSIREGDTPQRVRASWNACSSHNCVDRNCPDFDRIIERAALTQKGNSQ